MSNNKNNNKQYKYKRRIVHVYGSSPKKRGSLEEYFLLLTQKLNQEGFNSIFIFTKKIDDSLQKLYDDVGAKVIVMPGTEKRFDLRSIYRYRLLFIKISPVLINVHFGRTSFNATLGARLAGIKNIVWTKHSFYGQGPFYRKVSQIKIFASLIFLQGLLSKKIIAVSDGLREELIHYHLPKSKIIRIYLGINLNRYKNSKKLSPNLHELGIRDMQRYKIISCISQARPEKGLEHLIRAIPIIVKKFPDCRLLLVGGGPLTDSLKLLSQRLNVARYILFCGVRNDVEKIISISEFTILPSLTEGLPLVTLESIANNKPVIASEVGGLPEVIIDGLTGFLVPPQDERMLAEKIIYLLSDKALLMRMGEACLRQAKNFDVNSGVTKTIELYKEALNGGL